MASLAQAGTEIELSVAKQATMGLEAFLAAMKFSRYLTAEQARAVDDVMEEVYRALGDDNTYDPQAFKEALSKMQKALRP